jgi:hypothetical protein
MVLLLFVVELERSDSSTTLGRSVFPRVVE